MAHDLATRNGRTAMAYFGEARWYRLGTKLDNPPIAAEAIEAAGLDYRAELVPLRTDEGISVPERKAVIRSDTRKVLGVVGNGYVPIQNAERFSFVDAVVARISPLPHGRSFGKRRTSLGKGNLGPERE